MMRHVASFDVYDTVLMRRVVSKSTLHVLVARKLRAEGLLDTGDFAFCAARQRAEERATERARAAGHEARLHEIYDELEFDEACRARGLAVELELEERLLVPIAGAAELVRRERSSHSRIAFASDSALPLASIEDALRRAELLRDGDFLLVASASQTCKSDGKMYLQLAARAEVRPSEITHTGADPERDVAAAKRAGFETVLRTDGVPNRFERLLDGHAGSTGAFAGALAGASREARLATSAFDVREASIRDVSAGVVAPLLTAYVTWTLHRAVERNVTTLWFLGRDGQVLLDVARALAPRLGIDVPMRYLHASRLAWNLPALACDDERPIDWIWELTEGLSIRKLLARVGLEPTAFASELSARGFSDSDWSRPLRARDLERIEQFVVSDEFRAKARSVAEKHRALITRYFEEEGLLADARPALVTLAGNGNLQESSTAILRRAREGADPIGLYFALRSDGRERNMGEALAWLFDERTHDGLEGVVPGWGATPLRAFCAADHGTLLSYSSVGHGVKPVLRETRNGPVVDWGLKLVRRTLHAFVDALLLDPELVDTTADVREAVIASLRSFWFEPTAEEAAAWGAFPVESGFGVDTYYAPLARPRTWNDVSRALTQGRSDGTVTWEAGEVTLTPRLRNSSLKWSARASRVAQRLLGR